MGPNPLKLGLAQTLCGPWDPWKNVVKWGWKLPPVGVEKKGLKLKLKTLGPKKLNLKFGGFKKNWGCFPQRGFKKEILGKGFLLLGEGQNGIVGPWKNERPPLGGPCVEMEIGIVWGKGFFGGNFLGGPLACGIVAPLGLNLWLKPQWIVVGERNWKERNWSYTRVKKGFALGLLKQLLMLFGTWKLGLKWGEL